MSLMLVFYIEQTGNATLLKWEKLLGGNESRVLLQYTHTPHTAAAVRVSECLSAHHCVDFFSKDLGLLQQQKQLR